MNVNSRIPCEELARKCQMFRRDPMHGPRDPMHGPPTLRKTALSDEQAPPARPERSSQLMHTSFLLPSPSMHQVRWIFASAAEPCTTCKTLPRDGKTRGIPGDGSGLGVSLLCDRGDVRLEKKLANHSM